MKNQASGNPDFTFICFYVHPLRSPVKTCLQYTLRHLVTLCKITFWYQQAPEFSISKTRLMTQVSPDSPCLYCTECWILPPDSQTPIPELFTISHTCIWITVRPGTSSKWHLHALQYQEIHSVHTNWCPLFYVTSIHPLNSQKQQNQSHSFMLLCSVDSGFTYPWRASGLL